MWITRSRLLLLAALLAWSSCQQFEHAPPPRCTGAKCDNPWDQAESQALLMQKAPPGEAAISRDKAGQWLFHVVGQRGEVVLQSQAYVTRASAANGILSVEENGVDPGQYKVLQDPDGTWRFSLQAKNYQEIASSRSFATEAEAQAAVQEARDLLAAILQFKAEMSNGARFDLYRSQVDSEWYFKLIDEDGAELLYSEGYQSRTGAVNGIQSVRENGKDDARYVFQGTLFILKAKNGQEIARSGSFGTAQEAADGAKHVQQLLQSERVANPW